MTAGELRTRTSSGAVAGPMDGFRVIDLSSVIMGPWATHILADYGADVIKVEPPDGDITRKAGPMRHPDMGPLFLHANRNKRSIVLDLKNPAGRDALLRLCAGADVLIHNIRPAAMRRLSLSYEEVAAAHPRLIYVSLVGFGQDGPYASRPAYDDLIQGASGLASLFMRAGGDAPRYVPALLSDRIVGISAAHAVLAALLHRERTGEGQAIEIPMFETMAELVLSDHLGGSTFEPPEGPTGYNRLLAADRRPYRTKDGFICVLLYGDKHWRRFFEAAGEAELYLADARLSDAALRRSHVGDAYAVVARILERRGSAEWMDLLNANDIPVMPLNDIDGLIEDPHLAAVGFLHAEAHPSEGVIRTLGIPSRWSGSPPTRRLPAPRLGEQTVDILREAGFDDARIAALVAAGGTVPPADG